MKKIISIFISIILLLSFSGCTSNDNTVKYDSYDLTIIIPAGSEEKFVYSLQEIQPKRDKLTVYAGPDCPDTEVVLLPVEVTEENTYEPSYITNGMPTKLNAEKDAWFKVGVNIQNPTNEDIIIHVTLKDISVRDSQEVIS